MDPRFVLYRSRAQARPLAGRYYICGFRPHVLNMSFAPTAAEQRLTFNERPMKTSLIRYVSASAYNGATSTETVLGLGVDSGRVLNWFGKRIFSMTVDFVIHARLSAISTFITQRNSVTELRKKDVNRLQGVCAVLLELCRFVTHSCNLQYNSTADLQVAGLNIN
jgi:hypothetical protein